MEKLSYLSISHSDTHWFSTALPTLSWKQEEKRQHRAERAPEAIRSPYPASEPDSGGVLDSLMDFTDQIDFGRNRLQEGTRSVQLADIFPVGSDSLRVQLAAVPWTSLSCLSKAQPYLSWLHCQPLPAMQTQVRQAPSLSPCLETHCYCGPYQKGTKHWIAGCPQKMSKNHPMPPCKVAFICPLVQQNSKI